MMNNEFGLSGYELDLAKRGGVVKVINLYSPVHEVFYAKLVEPLGGWGYFAKCHGNRISTKDVLLFEAAYCTNDRETLEGYNVLGMATPKECEEAGVEYIEPPFEVDIGNNACFRSPDSRECIRNRLNLILAQFEEKS